MTEPEAMRILGLTTATTEEEVKRAWRKVVKQTHPDLHPNDPQATVRFQRVQEAYDLLRARVSVGPVSSSPSTVAPAWNPREGSAPQPYDNPVYRQSFGYRRGAYPAAGPAYQPVGEPPVGYGASQRLRKPRWDSQPGTWKWWVYHVCWKLTSIPFIALLIFSVAQHRDATAVQDQFRTAPRCAPGAEGDASCLRDQQGEVVDEECTLCPGASSVTAKPSVTLDIEGVRYTVSVVAPDSASRSAVFAFDHTPGAAKVAVRSWKGDVVSVAGLPTTANPLQQSDSWGVLSGILLAPIAWILLGPVRLVDFTFRILGIVIAHFFRLVALSLTRV